MVFELKAVDNKSNARAGVLSTGHGLVETPIFMPVGTAGSVKAVHQKEQVDYVEQIQREIFNELIKYQK